MIIASLLLVAVAAILLVVGMSRPADLGWVYASIATCVVAALLLAAGVARSRPNRRQRAQGDGEPPPSWTSKAPPPDDERS